MGQVEFQALYKYLTLIATQQGWHCCYPHFTEEKLRLKEMSSSALSHLVSSRVYSGPLLLITPSPGQAPVTKEGYFMTLPCHQPRAAGVLDLEPGASKWAKLPLWRWRGMGAGLSSDESCALLRLLHSLCS